MTEATTAPPAEPKGGFKLPSAYTILFILIVVVAALTWVIPYTARLRAGVVRSVWVSERDVPRRRRLSAADQGTVITTSRYSLGTTIVSSPNRLNRSISPRMSRAYSLLLPSPSASSASKAFIVGP